MRLSRFGSTFTHLHPLWSHIPHWSLGAALLHIPPSHVCRNCFAVQLAVDAFELLDKRTKQAGA